VTQSGGSIGFTVWGRKENTNYTTILGRVLAKYGIHPPKGAKTPFDISQDPEALAKEMRVLGFTDIRMWYQASNFQLQSAEDFLSSIINLPSVKQSHLFPDNDSVLAEKVKEDIKDDFRRVCTQ
jgi:hypothetical protein